MARWNVPSRARVGFPRACQSAVLVRQVAVSTATCSILTSNMSKPAFYRLCLVNCLFVDNSRNRTREPDRER